MSGASVAVAYLDGYSSFLYLIGGRFFVQPVDSARWLEPAHSGSPLYERRGNLDSHVFFGAAREFLKKYDVSPVADDRPATG